ncbi:GroES-like protein [Didymella exigua CBS 183.55]|uniref:GroES-like protein n=1 Tax=Didymella exigua CBS 183.55 TaxID=1150837 RepID=A0A6A5RUQ0_9PLEO|nr:GroES-like protein [Didymella exigua CBS 183.55]KAF1931100.1 GroES-like protein [Didymella exigua CBS 183.55]
MKALITTNTLYSRVANLALHKNLTTMRAQWKDVPIPAVSDNEILVKVHAVALNATDFKHIDAISPPNCITGCDYAGEVYKVGKGVSKLWSVGDRVAGAVHGGLYADRGSFAEYLKTDADLAWRIPETMEDAVATTYGVSAVTAVLALCGRLGFPKVETLLEPNCGNETGTIFVYAGSTSAGLSVIQLAKAFGWKVVTTTSPHSYDLVKSYGADAVFDYRDKNIGLEIAKAHPDIKIAVDCYSEGKSTKTCDVVLGSKGGQVITLLPSTKPTLPSIKHELIMAYTVFGHEFQWLPPIGPKFAVVQSDRDMLARFYEALPQLTDVLRPLPVAREARGMDAILPGLDKLREGKVSGSKLVIEF